MTIEKQNKINTACRRPLTERLFVWAMDGLFVACAPLVTIWVLAEQRQAVRAYRKRNQLDKAELLERCWEMDLSEKGRKQ